MFAFRLQHFREAQLELPEQKVVKAIFQGLKKKKKSWISTYSFAISSTLLKEVFH